MHPFPYRYLALLTATLFSVSACSSISDSNWFSGSDEVEEEALGGTRLEVLSDKRDYHVDDSLEQAKISVPPAMPISAWHESSGNKQHHITNIALPDFAFDSKDSTEAGGGEGWKGHHAIAPVGTATHVFSVDSEGVVSAYTHDNLSSPAWVYEDAKLNDYYNRGGGIAAGDNQIIVTLANGTTFGLRSKDGALLWRKDLQTPVLSAPHIAGDIALVTASSSQLFALNIDTGRLLWRHRGIEEQLTIASSVTPASYGNIAVTTYSSGEIYGIDVLTGRALWSDSLLNPSRLSALGAFSSAGGNPVISNGLVFTSSSNGVLAANVVGQGVRIWERAISSHTTPWIAGRYMYVLGTDDTLLALHAPDGRIKWTVPLRELLNDEETAHFKGPYMINGRLILMSDSGYWYEFAAETGQLLNRYGVLDAGSVSDLAIVGTTAYVVTQSGTLHAIR